MQIHVWGRNANFCVLFFFTCEAPRHLELLSSIETCLSSQLLSFRRQLLSWSCQCLSPATRSWLPGQTDHGWPPSHQALGKPSLSQRQEQ